MSYITGSITAYANGWIKISHNDYAITSGIVADYLPLYSARLRHVENPEIIIIEHKFGAFQLGPPDTTEPITIPIYLVGDVLIETMDDLVAALEGLIQNIP